MNRTLRIALPILVVVGGALVALAIIATRPHPEARVPEEAAPLVRVAPVEQRDVRLNVQSQGTVRPHTESTLVAEVAGAIRRVSPSFRGGDFFRRGEVLAEIDPHDYQMAVTRAQADVARARVTLERERQEAAVASREWEELGRGEASPLVLREPQLAEAEALLEAAQAALQQARANLERTRIRAPYDGRVREKMADVGQFVTAGTPIARIFSTDYVEITLPIPDDRAQYVDLPLAYAAGQRGRGAPVILRAMFAGRQHEWRGQIVRTEGELDPRSRMIQAVARVDDPYGRSGERPPLAVGMFVNAEIQGHAAAGVAVIPRAALRRDDTVFVVTGEERLELRRVSVLRADDREALVRDGLAAGERVLLTPLDLPVEGMRVRVAQAAGGEQERP